MFRGMEADSLRKLKPQRVLVIKPSAMGDVVQALPLLPALRATWPLARISWLINRELRGLVEGHPDLDEVIEFHRKGGWPHWRGLAHQLRASNFDVVFDLQGLLRSAVMTWATGAPVRVGLQTAREGASTAVNCVVPNTSREVTAWQRYWQVAEVLGQGNAKPQTIVTVNRQEAMRAHAWLELLPRPWLAIHPGAKWVTKRWPAEKFAEVATYAAAAYGGTAILVGAPNERDLASQVAGRLKRHWPSATVLNLSGQTSLKELAAVLTRCDVVLSNDSGPMHLAAGLGTPVVGLFTCTSPAISGPAGTGHRTLSADVPCAGSYHKTCPFSGIDRHACFDRLSTSHVWSTLRAMLAAKFETTALRAA